MKLGATPAPSSGRWPVWKIALALYPLAAGAAAVNFYFLGLLIYVVGLKVFSPSTSVWAGVLLGVPVAYFFARHIFKLISKAEST